MVEVGERILAVAGVIAQGLMTVIGILAADYCWANYSSWMRTMNVSRSPSEWVV